MIQKLCIALLSLMPFCVQADWILDNQQSSLSFVSIKNGAVVERHSFKDLEGRVTGSGDVTFTVNLDSVDTIIPIRNERMREMLFNTNKFPQAKVSVQLDNDIIKTMITGQSAKRVEVSGSLEMAGQTQRVTANLLVNTTTDGGITVTSAAPILLAAGQWGLSGGIEALRAIAGLNSITPVVPVSFALKFVPGEISGSEDAPQNTGEVVF